MSTTTDWFACPQCNGPAHKDQDNTSGDIYYACAGCDWHGEPQPVSEPEPEPNHQEQVYQCQDCNHTMTEQQLKGKHVKNGYVLYCEYCGSNHIRLWVG